MKLSSHQDQNVCLDPQDFTWDIFTTKAFTCWFSVLLLEYIYFISTHSKRPYLPTELSETKTVFLSQMS